ncbi:MAG: transcription antitermination factor NusB, partial [Bacteroidaceae bacterium]|nr:transcription antitermination factor NusB [Bacteroidaceae bacterium]
MINRVLIRLKAVQLVYAFYQNGSNNLDAAEKELFFSLSKAYDLYKYLLLLMAEITRFGRHNVAQLEQRAVNTHSGETYSHKFIDNRFIAQLEKNKQLIEFQETQKKNWIGEEAFIRSMYKRIISSDIYQEYMASED